MFFATQFKQEKSFVLTLTYSYEYDENKQWMNEQTQVRQSDERQKGK